MKNNSLIVTVGIICLFALIYFIYITKSHYKSQNHYNDSKRILTLDSICLNPQLDSTINNKLILRLKKGYCSACIEDMLLELNDISKLNNSNFVILTQFSSTKEVQIFKQYTKQIVINYPQDIKPLDTILFSHAYFFTRKEQETLYYLEYSKGYQYQKFLLKMLE